MGHEAPFPSWLGNDNLYSSNALGNDYLDSSNALESFFFFLILKAKANSVFQLLLPLLKIKTKQPGLFTLGWWQ